MTKNTKDKLNLHNCISLGKVGNVWVVLIKLKQKCILKNICHLHFDFTKQTKIHINIHLQMYIHVKCTILHVLDVIINKL